MGRRNFRNARGFTYLGVLFAVALAGIALSLTAEVWRTTSQRAREQQLLFVGSQFMQAIERYYQQSPGRVRQYPKSLAELLQDQRYPEVRRYLRRVYADPMTGKPDWGLVRARDGGITGVYSLSTDKPVRFAVAMVNGVPIAGGKYSDWVFVYDPNVAPTNAGQPAVTTALPGADGGARAQPPAANQGSAPAQSADSCRMVVLEGNFMFCQ